jgi:hypothetical protein
VLLFLKVLFLNVLKIHIRGSLLLNVYRVYSRQARKMKEDGHEKKFD